MPSAGLGCFETDLLNIGGTLKSLRSRWHRAVVTVVAASRREANLTHEQLAGGIEARLQGSNPVSAAWMFLNSSLSQMR
jgi:hypothetical protein